jgi:predicted methyltransferase
LKNDVSRPLLTLQVHEQLMAGARRGATTVECSLDLQRSIHSVQLEVEGWVWHGQRYPYLQAARERTVYYWTGEAFEPVARFAGGLYKLVPTQWGAPTFEIDGIKMLPSEHISPFADAEHKVKSIHPRSKLILDTCGGLGYFAACCLQSNAAHVHSFEKNAEVLWLRSLNPWSPAPSAALTLIHGDILEHIVELPAASVDAVLHDPPRFGIAGELYSQAFYAQLARVLTPKGELFHYVGTPNKLTSGRDVPAEVMQRLERAGFSTRASGDGVLAVRRR